jgi:hypothetical protein
MAANAMMLTMVASVIPAYGIHCYVGVAQTQPRIIQLCSQRYMSNSLFLEFVHIDAPCDDYSVSIDIKLAYIMYLRYVVLPYMRRELIFPHMEHVVLTTLHCEEVKRQYQNLTAVIWIATVERVAILEREHLKAQDFMIERSSTELYSTERSKIEDWVNEDPTPENMGG